jgi:hypothetical protein
MENKMRRIKIDKMKILAIVLCIAIIGSVGFVIYQLSTLPNIFEPANHKLSLEIVNVYVLNTSAIKLTLFNNCSQRLFNCIANVTSPVKAVAPFGMLETDTYMNLTIAPLKTPLPEGTNETDIIVDVYGYGIS